jgi:hypothetical protein
MAWQKRAISSPSKGSRLCNSVETPWTPSERPFSRQKAFFCRFLFAPSEGHAKLSTDIKTQLAVRKPYEVLGEISKWSGRDAEKLWSWLLISSEF